MISCKPSYYYSSGSSTGTNCYSGVTDLPLVDLLGKMNSDLVLLTSDKVKLGSVYLQRQSLSMGLKIDVLTFMKLLKKIQCHINLFMVF